MTKEENLQKREENLQRIAESFKRFRKQFRLDQREVARAIGIPYQSYQSYEYGKSVPSAHVIMELADKYGVTTDYLLGLSGESNPAAVGKTVSAAASDKLIKAALAFNSAFQEILAEENISKESSE